MTRRTLLLIVVAIIAVVAVAFFIRGRGSSSSATPLLPTVTPTPTALQAAILQRQTNQATFQSFAKGILPSLTNSVSWMEKTTADAAAAKSTLAAFNACNDDSGRVDAYQTEAAATPWPPLSTPARKWRHTVFGIYHLYFGGVVECRNAYDTQDSGQSALAISDLAKAARQLNAQVNYAQSVAAGKVKG